MSESTKKDLFDQEELVLTPGGPRPRSRAIHVRAGEGVVRDRQSGSTVRSIAHLRSEAERKRAEGLVLTPGGFRHPSLVYKLEREHVVKIESGKTRLWNRSTRKTLDLPPAAPPVPGLGTGWITDAFFPKPAGVAPISLFTTKWKVPPPPKSIDGQTIFLFNAMEDASFKDILQPVLQWGKSSAGGGDYWSVTSWFLDASGNAFYRDLVRVFPGLLLQGTMRLTNQNNGTFDYECLFEGIGETDITVQGIVEQTVFSETLECYAIDNCSDYPDTYYTSMFAIEIDSGGNPIQPGWLVENQVTDCGQHTNIVSNASPGGEVDLFYKRVAPHWNLQHVTGGTARTFGPAAVEAPSISVFNQQQHFAYRDAAGLVWDAWYDGGSGNWNLQKLNSGGLTDGPLANGVPFACVFGQQQHFTYPDGAGGLWDAWYDSGGGNWSLQKINTGAFNGGMTGGPLAVNGVYTSTFGQQQHFGYLDSAGKIWDSWYDSGSNHWNLQQINLKQTDGAARTNGPAAVAGPAISVFGNQQHFAYRDGAGAVWDSWYDSGNNSWNLQQVNLKQINPDAKTSAPAAAADIAVSVFFDQQHFAYIDAGGTVWDCWYASATNHWDFQQINNAGKTAGPLAVAHPSVSVYGQQQHFAYRDSAGVLWDAWYDRGSNSWNLQQLTGAGGRTDGPAAISGPEISVFGDQQHFAYIDAVGAIRDAWYDGSSNSWNLQQLVAGGLTDGPAAAADPFVSVYGQQQHIAYRGFNARVWDAWYDGDHWNLQQINENGVTAGGPAFSGPFISVFGEQQHFAYRDRGGDLLDSWYDSGPGTWNLQTINRGGVTNGPATPGEPAVSVFGEQQHFCYLDRDGVLWDSWYDSGSNSWNLQQINNGGRTDAPLAIGQLSVAVTGGQQHFTYRDNGGIVWDCWYDSGSDAWNKQQINLGGNTNAPAAAGDPFLTIFHGQQHVAYRDSGGVIWDCWYDPGTTNWSVQQMNGGGLTTAPLAASDPFVCALDHAHHFAYSDGNGAIWDVWYLDSTLVWDRQQINLGAFSNSGETTGPIAVGRPFVWGYDSQLHFTYRTSDDTIWDAWYAS
jgi:hypothetical protein